MPRMLPDGRRLGAHLPLGRGMVKAVDRAHEIGADALQVFADNPTAWRRRAAPPAEGPAFRERLDRARHPACRHPRVVPRQPGGSRRGLLRPVGRRAGQRAARRALVRGALRQRPRRLASRGGRAGRDRATGRRARARDGRGRPDARWADDRAREQRGQRLRSRHERGRAGRHRGGLPGARHRSGSAGLLPRRRPCLGGRDRPVRPGTRPTGSWPTSMAASASIGWS